MLFLTISTNLLTVSELPDFRNATYKSIRFSEGSKGTKEIPGGAIFLTQAGANAIPSPEPQTATLWIYQ